MAITSGIKKRAILTLIICFLPACGKGVTNFSSSQNQPTSQTDPVSQNTFRWDRETCSSWTDTENGNRIDFCFKATQALSPVGKTLYAFHGMGGNPQGFCSTLTSQISSFERTRSISHVICPSFGPHWAIHENGRTESFARFQAYMQQTHGASSTLKPVLYGESMGGFNAIKISGALNPEQLKFQKVGVSCPAIFSIRLPSRTIGSWIPQQVFGSFDRDTSLSLIQDSPYFDTSVTYPEPLILANTNDQVGRHTFNVSGLSVQTFGGIYQGARDFYENQQGRGAAAQFRDLPGGHCENIPREDMITFLGR